MNAQDKAIAWKKIESLCGKIVDPVLKNSILGELSARAEKYWGYCPADTKADYSLKLEDWEQALLDCIEVSKQYGVMMLQDQEYSQSIQKENEKWMINFIRLGGDYKDLPSEIKNDYVLGLYSKMLTKYGEEIDEKIKHLF